MFDKLEDLLNRFEEILNELGEPGVTSDPAHFQKLMKEQSELQPIVTTYREYKKTSETIADSLSMLEEEKDEEMRSMLKEELSEARDRLPELEKELNKTLLVRTSKNVSLTPDGLLFRETARDMLALYQKAVAQKAESADLVGEIYLGAGETESFSYMADRIRDFRKSHPKVVFHIISTKAFWILAILCSQGIWNGIISWKSIGGKAGVYFSPPGILFLSIRASAVKVC